MDARRAIEFEKRGIDIVPVIWRTLSVCRVVLDLLGQHLERELPAFQGLAVSVVHTARADESDQFPAQRASPWLELLLHFRVARLGTRRLVVHVYDADRFVLIIFSAGPRIALSDEHQLAIVGA